MNNQTQLAAPVDLQPQQGSGDIPAKGLARAALISSIAGIVLILIGIIPGFLGLCLTLDARQRGNRSPVTKLSLILSIIAIAASFFICNIVLSVIMNYSIINVLSSWR